MESSTFHLSRRGFLLAGGVAWSGLTFIPRCHAWGEDQKLAKLSLAIVSDTHLGYQDKEHAARQWELPLDLGHRAQ